MIDSAGKITVPVPGTPVTATSNMPSQSVRPTVMHAVMFQALPTNTGKVYIGKSNMSKSAFTGLFGVVAIPGTNVCPSVSIAHTIAPNGLKLGDFWIDADVAGEGVIVVFLQT